jgi:GT2 family glycosyltransferase
MFRKLKVKLRKRYPQLMMRGSNIWRLLQNKPLKDANGVRLVAETPAPLVVEPEPPKRHGKEIPDNIRINYPITDTFLSNLRWLRPDKPEVSIIILSYLRPDLVENLIRSIWLHTQGFLYEIIVVDNGSPVGEHDLGRVFRERTKVVTLLYNQYLGDAYNIGVEQASGSYLVLMNNDIVVEPNWLAPLVSPLAIDPSVGAVGPRFLYPTGQLQEAGALIDAQGYSVQLGKRGVATAPQFNQKREVDYCTGATIALRRSDFIDVLGYDRRWSPGYYEDVDLCFKLRERGKRTIYVPTSTVFHIESATMVDTPPAENLGAAIDDNRRQLVAKWPHILSKSGVQSFRPCAAVAGASTMRFEAIAAPRPVGRKTMAIFFPYEFIPGGGEKFALSIAEQFRDEADIVLVFEGHQSILRVMSVLDDLGFPDLVFRMMTLEQARSHGPFDIFLLIGNELFPLREAMGRRNFFICQFPFPTTHEVLSYYQGLGFYKNYESYLVYSEYVRDHIRRRFDAWRIQDVKIEVLSPTADEVGVPADAKPLEMIGVGRFFAGGHNKRHDVMIEVLDLIRQREPQLDVSLQLAGALHKESQHREHLSKLRLMAGGLPVQFQVDKDREELNSLYRRARVYLHAAGWGVDVEENPEMAEHFGISILEAMSAGCIPIVCAVGGPIEIVQHGVNGVAVGSVSEMAEWSIRVMRDWDTPLVRQWRDNAVSTAKRYGKATFARRVRELIAFDAASIETASA